MSVGFGAYGAHGAHGVKLVKKQVHRCIVSEMMRGLDPLLRNELGDEVLAALGESLNHF